MGSLAEADGKLLCPSQRCRARVGAWNWSCVVRPKALRRVASRRIATHRNRSGDQCSCGAWVTPSLQISTARVDANHATRLVPRRGASESASAVSAVSSVAPHAPV
jgi:hypothetical protein